jgi:outer membrane protein with beta-barrel domain
LSRHILALFFVCGLWIAAASAQTKFSRFNFDAGGGFGIGRGDVANFTSTSYNGVVGGGLNFSRKFGVNAEYLYYNLAFKSNVIQQQSLPGAKGHLQSVTLNGIYTLPLNNRWGFYGIGGFGWYQRSVSARSEVLTGGFTTPCQPAWIWWGITCVNGFVSPTQTLSSRTLDAVGFNFGGGITYRLPWARHAKFYAEGRYHRAYHSDVKTIVFPVTVGLRW